MEFQWIVLICALALCSLLLLAYLLLLRCSIREVAEELEEKLRTDTNTLISISTGDKAVRALAAQINRQLRALRRERLRLQAGNDALADAVTDISHDLRTPLTAVCGYLDLLEQEPQSERARRYLAHPAGADGRHVRPDGGAVSLFGDHRHGRRAEAGAGLPESCAGAEPCGLLRCAVGPGHHAGHPDAGAGSDAAAGRRGPAARF